MLDLLDGEELYNKVDKIRLQKGLSIYELAKKANVSSSAFYHWRDKKSLPSLTLLNDICYAFEISLIDFLLDGDAPISLTDEQKELLNLWNKLSSENKRVVINLMKTMQK